MKRYLKDILKKILPEKVVSNLNRLKPDIRAVNIYLLKKNTLIEKLHPIDKKYTIRQLTIDDSEKLKEFYVGYEHVHPRFASTAWIGLAVIDTTNDAIAYVSWVIIENIQFINDFNIKMKKNQFMVRHGFCAPEYRHQGLHTRMEQERINYCISNGANEIFVHIASDNKVGIQTLIDAGYIFRQRNIVIRIPKFGIYRELYSWIKSPFKKLI